MNQNLADLLSVECDIEIPDEAIVYIETAGLSSCQNVSIARIANLMGQLVLKLATRSATGVLIDASIQDTDVPLLSGSTPSFAKESELVQ